MNQLPVQRASELSIDSAPLTQWLVQGLWSDQAVGILGGEPKCCKSFLALDLAVSVASGTPCLRRLLSSAPDPCFCFPPKTLWPWYAGAWKGSARQPVSISSLCQWKLSPPRRSGWTHLRTGNGSATPSRHANRTCSFSTL
jgi:hypothetical protein